MSDSHRASPQDSPRASILLRLPRAELAQLRASCPPGVPFNTHLRRLLLPETTAAVIARYRLPPTVTVSAMYPATVAVGAVVHRAVDAAELDAMLRVLAVADPLADLLSAADLSTPRARAATRDAVRDLYPDAALVPTARPGESRESYLARVRSSL